jgi:hypothetical protein
LLFCSFNISMMEEYRKKGKEEDEDEDEAGKK